MVIEAFRSPQRVVSCVSRSEVEVVASVEFVDSVLHIGRGMALDDIHNHKQASGMAGIDQSLETEELSSTTIKSVGVPKRDEMA